MTIVLAFRGRAPVKWKKQLVRFIQSLSLLLFWPGTILIAWGELTPQPPQLGGVFGWDKLEHFIAYFGLAGMATLALGLRQVLGWAILGVILFGGLLEILQGYTGRDPEVMDFVANSLGAIAGLGAGVLFLRLFDPLVDAKAAD
jgi:VanZ family protein